MNVYALFTACSLLLITLRSSRIAVAYVQYEKASCAAAAIESLHGAILNNGQGPTLKVMLADAPAAR